MPITPDPSESRKRAIVPSVGTSCTWISSGDATTRPLKGDEGGRVEDHMGEGWKGGYCVPCPNWYC